MKTSEANAFDITEEQLIGLYEEILVLSKKKPDGSLNKFKIKFINELLTKANKLLGKKYLPFEDFSVFDDSSLPSASDVVMVLSQYLKVMDKYRFDHIRRDIGGRWHWRVDDGEKLETKPPKFSEK